MSFTVDSVMMSFADKLNISSTRMNEKYTSKNIDEIIEAEAAQGNMQAVAYAQEVYDDPAKLLKIFSLANVDNRYKIIMAMDTSEIKDLLPYLDPEELVMGLYFFKKEKILDMLLDVKPEEIVKVMLDIFGLSELIELIPPKDLEKFFESTDIKKDVIAEQLKNLSKGDLSAIVESITGQPITKVKNPDGVIENLKNLKDDQFKEIMSQMEPDVQRHLVYLITKKDDKYLQIFENETYVKILETKMKDDIIPAMDNLEPESLVDMISELPHDLMAVVAAQIDESDLLKFVRDDMNLLLEAFMK